MILADTSVWIDHLRGRETPKTALLTQAIRSDDIVVGDLVLLEVLQGVRSEKEADRLEHWLRRFPLFDLFDARLATRAAGHVRALRSRGITLRKTVDVIIATWCIAHAVPLLHADVDFTHFERHCGLQAA